MSALCDGRGGGGGSRGGYVVLLKRSWVSIIGKKLLFNPFWESEQIKHEFRCTSL